MALVLALAPLLTGFVRKVKARLVRRRGPPLHPALPRSLAADAQGGGAGRERLLAVPRRALSDLRRRPGWRRRWCPTFATGLMFSWSADLIAIIALLGSARFFLALAGHGRRDQLRRHRLLARGDDRLAGRAGHADDRLLPGAAGRLDPALHRRRLHAVVQRRPAGHPGAVAGRPDHGGHRRERAHPGRQPRHPPGADHGPRGHGAGVFRPPPGGDRAGRRRCSCCSTSR